MNVVVRWDMERLVSAAMDGNGVDGFASERNVSAVWVSRVTHGSCEQRSGSRVKFSMGPVRSGSHGA